MKREEEARGEGEGKMRRSGTSISWYILPQSRGSNSIRTRYKYSSPQEDSKSQTRVHTCRTRSLHLRHYYLFRYYWVALSLTVCYFNCLCANF